MIALPIPFGGNIKIRRGEIILKKNNLLVVIGLLLVMLIITACGESSSDKTNDNNNNSDNTAEKPAKVYELDYNLAAAPTSAFSVNVAYPWAEYVNEKTNGAVKINIYPAAALGTLGTSFSDINGRVYEMGQVPPGSHADTDLFPLTIADVPFLLNSPGVAHRVLKSYVEEFMSEDVFTDSTFLTVSSTDAFQLYGKKVVKSPEDLKNEKVSDSVKERITLLQTLGAVPTSLANTEIYESLERGIVDFSNYTAVGANGFKLDEVTTNMTKLDIGVSVLLFLINTEFYESLPEEIQTQFMEDFAPKYAEMATELYTNNAEEGIQIYEEKVKEKGGSVYIPTEEEMNEFKKPVREQMNEWANRADERGYDGQAMVDFYLDLLEKEGVSLPE